MAKLQTSVCPQCGNTFSYYPSSRQGKQKTYCSKSCRSKATRINTICPQCGKPFWYYKSWPRKYCSRKCSAAVNSKANLGIKELGPMSCDVCGKEITGQKWRGRRFCSRKCFAKHLSRTLKGIPRPEVRGKKPHLYKRVEKQCPQCGKVFMVKQSQASRRRFCSKICHSRWLSESGTMAGDLNRNWQGGPFSYYGPNWVRQRRTARHRDNYTCQLCGVSEQQLGRELDVHHVVPFRNFGVAQYQQANRLSNLISLCNKCHLIVEHKMGHRPSPPSKTRESRKT